MGKARRRKLQRNKAQNHHFPDDHEDGHPAGCTGQHQQAPAATVAVAQQLPAVQGAVAALQLADNAPHVDWSALPMEALQNVLSFVSLTQRLCRSVEGYCWWNLESM
jgi:hypothetical protein